MVCTPKPRSARALNQIGSDSLTMGVDTGGGGGGGGGGGALGAQAPPRFSGSIHTIYGHVCF